MRTELSPHPIRLLLPALCAIAAGCLSDLVDYWSPLDGIDSGVGVVHGDADSDGDSDSDGDMCADYPTADNNFAVGSVVRNYTLFDKTDTEHQLCEFGGGSNTLLFLAITATS